MKALNNLLQSDYEELRTYFPKLVLTERNGIGEIFGELDICNDAGCYLKTYSIRILVPPHYPFAVPILYETSLKIRRTQNRHLDEYGLCCVGMEHELQIRAFEGLRVENYLRDYVYPFFANQIYCDYKKEFANGEYKHEFLGVRDFYSVKLNMPDPNTNIKILTKLLMGRAVDDRFCICDSGKRMKSCHGKAIELLKKVSLKRLIEDYHGFMKVLNPQYSSLDYFQKKNQISPISTIFKPCYFHPSLDSNKILQGNSKT